MRVDLAMRLYKYMRDMTPKREKIAKKCTFIFEIVLYDRWSLQNYRIWGLAYDKQKEKCEERAKVEGKFLARTRNAHTSYSDFDFLLSQVSQ